MAWDVYSFITPRGDKIVRKFIEGLGETVMAKVDHKVKLLMEYGPQLGMPHSKKIGDNLYELRIRGNDEIRIIYSFIKNNIYLLHAFKKKTDGIPERELKTAIQRKRDLT